MLYIGGVRVFCFGVIAAVLTLSCAVAGPAVVMVDGARGAQKNVTLAAGSILVVELAGTPGTGFRWIAAGPLPAFLKLQDEDSGQQGVRPGQEVRQRLSFAVTGAGEGRIVLHYRRSWEPVTGKEDAFILDVVAK